MQVPDALSFYQPDKVSEIDERLSELVGRYNELSFLIRLGGEEKDLSKLMDRSEELEVEITELGGEV